MPLNFALPLDRSCQSKSLEGKVKLNLETSNRRPHNFRKMPFEGPLREVLRMCLKYTRYVRLGLPQDVRSKSPRDVGMGRPQDREIGPLELLLERLEGKFLRHPGDQHLPAGKIELKTCGLTSGIKPYRLIFKKKNTLLYSVIFPK